MRITFKTEKPTGRYASFENSRYVVKGDGKEIGLLYQYENGVFYLALAIEKDAAHTDTNKNRPWMWVYIDRPKELLPLFTLTEARAWVKRIMPELEKKYTIHQFN